MSNRSLIEINHDYTPDISVEFLKTLRRYLKSASRETAAELERFGVRVIGMRHHSGKFILDGTPDGFPVSYLTQSPSTPEVAGEAAPSLAGSGRDPK